MSRVRFLIYPWFIFSLFFCRWVDPNFSWPAFEWHNLDLNVLKIYEYSSLYFVRCYRFVDILSCPTYWEESSRLRPLHHRGFHNRYHWWCNWGFHNKWWCNKRLKQFVCTSRFQLQIDQVILCLKSSVNQQKTWRYMFWCLFQTFQIFHAHVGKKAPH